MSGTFPPSPLRVLVVDDCPDTTVTLSWLLRSWGHDVRVASDGLAALEVASAYQPHVALLDVGLPGMNGYDVARQLRTLPSLVQILLICMTGYGMEANRLRSQEAGFDHHLIKPADPEDLRRLLASRKASSADGEPAP